MQPANKFDVNQGGRLLTIHDVDTRDSGKYLCSAVNKAGEDTSAAVLEVVGKSQKILEFGLPFLLLIISKNYKRRKDLIKNCYVVPIKISVRSVVLVLNINV